MDFRLIDFERVAVFSSQSSEKIAPMLEYWINVEFIFIIRGPICPSQRYFEQNSNRAYFCRVE